MQRGGMLNSSIAKVLADLGHTDTIVIGDCGLPVPAGVPKIDLALKPGMPSFVDGRKHGGDGIVLVVMVGNTDILSGESHGEGMFTFPGDTGVMGEANVLQEEILYLFLCAAVAVSVKFSGIRLRSSQDSGYQRNQAFF